MAALGEMWVKLSVASEGENVMKTKTNVRVGAYNTFVNLGSVPGEGTNRLSIFRIGP